MQEIIDKKIENKVNALEETVLLTGQEITNLKIKLSLRCHAEFKWTYKYPLQVNESMLSLRNALEIIFVCLKSYSDFSTGHF